uniref:EGF-like domain-containing protein n=1 Tax=Hippocampus comes TaxID=109280 RepID=A0A3Q3DLT2_HIPCM
MYMSMLYVFIVCSMCIAAMCFPPCAHGGTCMRWNKCLCSPGWTGEAVTTPCVPPCRHGATCSPHNTCTCPEGTTGLRSVCELPCANGGRCVGPDTCQCPSDYTGSQCLLRESPSSTTLHGQLHPAAHCFFSNNAVLVCFFIALCTPACQNGGRCVDVNKCTCVGGWQGARCQIGKILPSFVHVLYLFCPSL